MTTVDLYYDNGAVLTNVATGQTLGAGFTITRAGDSTSGGLMGEPLPGTPAYQTFQGFTDFYDVNAGANVVLLYGALSGYTPAVYTLTFTNLDPAKRYSFKGTVTRGTEGASSPYTNRWTVCAIQGADGFVEAHTSGCLTNGDTRIPAGTMTNGQAAFNSGINLDGDLVDWERISPGPDGQFAIEMRQWLGPIPGGTAGYNYAYSLTAMRLEEMTLDGPPQITQALANQTNVVGSTVTLQVSAVGTEPLSYHWFTNDVLAAVNTSGIFITDPLRSGSNFLCTVIVSNALGTATNSALVWGVVANPYITLVAPTNNASFTAPASVPLQAMALSSPAGSITGVGFFSTNSGLLASVLTSPYTNQVTLMLSNTYAIYAIATNNYGLTKVSSTNIISVTAGNIDLDSGLVAHWALNEGAGSLAADSSGFNNHGTLANGASWTSGKFYGGVQFDGRNDFVDVPDAPALNPSGSALTLSIWFNSVNVPSGAMMISKGISGIQYNLRVFADIVRFRVNADGVITDHEVSYSFAAGTWYHVAGVYNGATMQVFVNGAPVGNALPKTGNLTFDAGPLALGKRSGSNNNFHNGALDDARIYARALSAAEIAALANITDDRAWDFGDAPDPSYATLAASDGPRHQIGLLYLGSRVDPEPDARQSSDAAGDDADNFDDEDGVVFVSPLSPGDNYAAVEVIASMAGRLDAWIDFGADGTWGNPGDQIISNVPLQAGLNSLEFPVPAAAQLGGTYARFRLSSAGGLGRTGAATDGEVEDYQVEITAPVANTIPPTIASVFPQPGTDLTSLSSIQVTFSERVANVDAADLLVNGIPAIGLSGSGATYTFTVTQPSIGLVNITWTPGHGIVDRGQPALPFDENGNGGSWSYRMADNTPPSVVTQNPPGGATLTNLNQVQVTFSEEVFNVDAPDFLINGVAALGRSGSGSNYTFFFAQPIPGQVTITWADLHGITDQSGNPFDGWAKGATWQYTLEAPRVILVATNATWRLFKGLSEASSPIDAWHSFSFDDSSWSDAPGPFFYDADYPQSYYGNTELTDMYQQYLTIYLRHRFVVDNPLSLTNLVLKTKYDDGIIVWLNGAELYRSPTVDPGDIPYTYPDSSVVRVNQEPLSFDYYVIPMPASVLAAGTNVLAVHGLNAALPSSDLLIDFELYASTLDPSISPPAVAAVNPPAGDVFSLNSITVIFNEAVTNVDASDLLINGVAATDVTGASNAWTFSFSQPAYGPVNVTWAANHGITDLDSPPKPFDATAAGASFQYALRNPNAPIIANQIPVAGATIYQLTQIQVSWNENVTGVDASDLLINSVPATSVSGEAATRTFTFAQPPYGPVAITWAANHGITDLEPASNPFDPTRSGNTWQYTLVDQTPPSIVAQTPPAGSLVTNLTQVQVTFSEPVSGVNASDLLINGVPATGLNGAGTSYTFSFPQPNATTVNVSWAPNHGIRDLAAIPNTFDATASTAQWLYYTPDNVPPTTVSISPPPGATVRSLTEITILFTETVSGLDTNDLLLNNHPAQSLLGSGAGPYTFQFAAPPDGAVTLEWAPNHGIQDLATPANAFVGQGWTYQVDPNARFEGAILINEIMFHPNSENSLEEYIELRNVSSDAINLAGWQFSRGVSFTFPNVSMSPGSYLVVAANLNAFAVKYPEVTNVIGGWTGRLSNIDEDLELVDAGGASVNRVHYADEGDWALRQRGPNDGGYYGWEWYNEADGTAINTATGQSIGGKSLELMNPALPNGLGANWSPSALVHGTPGQPNSMASTNIAPLISAVIHYPAVPKPSETVTISARIRDEQIAAVSVQLFYRDHSTRTPPTFSSTNMFDDGLHNDGAAGDGMYATVLPAYGNNTVIEFYVQAADAQNNTRSWPAAARQLDGTFAQTANALYQVDEDLAPAGPANASQPFYRLIMTESERYEFANIYRWSDAEMNGTFITFDATGFKVRYNVGIRIRGNGTRGRAVANLRVNVPTDRRWNGVNELNLNTQFIHAQLAGSALAAKAALPAAETRVVQVRLNGANLASSLTAPAHWSQSGEGDGFGSYLYLESMNPDWAQRLMPTNSGGNCYRAGAYPWIANLKFLDTTNQATWEANGYTKASNQSENDWSDLRELTRTLSAGLPEAEYLEAVRTNVNVQLFMRYLALCNLVDFNETALCNGVGDDYAMYRGGVDRRFMLNPHDFDTILGQGDSGGGNTAASIWRMIDNPPSTASDQQALFLIRFMRHPQFAPVYYREYKRLLDTTFSPAEFNSLLDQVLGGWVPTQIINNMKTFMDARRTSVWGQLPLTFSVNTLPAQAGSSSFTLSGRANAIDTASVLVNGVVSSYSVWQGRWTNTMTLQPGLNNLLVQCLDTNNAIILQTNLTILYDDGNVATYSGTLGGDTVWSAAGGPYSVPSTLTIPQGVKLTIQPGASAYLGSGASLVVNGQLLAEGTEYQRIRFTRPPESSGNWGNIVINDSPGSPETRISYADFEFNAANVNTPCLQVSGGTVRFDHLTFGNTAAPYVHVDGASFVISDCVFPSPTASFEPIHGVGGIKSGGQGIFLRNFFGAVTGYQDTIDFSGGHRPGPIVQFINNVFMGSGDDNLDLDNTDAWVAGNIFMHVHKNGSPDTASAVSGGTDTGETSEITILGNIFYDCDHAAMAKQGNFYTLINNTVVHQSHQGGTDDDGAVICLQDNNMAEGAGMYLEGNILYDIEKLVRNLTNALVTFTNNLMPLTWNGPGGNNSTVDPLLNYLPQVSETTSFTSWAQAQVLRQWFALRTGSPASGAGPNGSDLGGVVPFGVTISGEPISPTSQATATLMVGVNRTANGIPSAGWPNGSGYTHYRWRLDGGPWSAETPLSTPISLSGLSNGPHYVEVVGRNDAGLYQDDPLLGPDAKITTSRTWTISPIAPTLRLNEVLASNDGAFGHYGTSPDCIELFNSGSLTQSLSGIRISDDPQNPDKFVFPPSATLAPGSYLVLLADEPNGTPGYHLGFRLNQQGHSIYLFDTITRGGALLDSIAFGPQLTDFSVGRLADGEWALTIPTLGSANRAAPLGDPRALKLNEWLASGQVVVVSDFVELFNPGPLPVALGGLYLTDNSVGWPDRHQIAPLSFIAQYGFLAFIADNQVELGATHLNFQLGSEQGLIGLFDSALNGIDSIYYGPQFTDISQGRSPNGASSIVQFSRPTPGLPNPVSSSGTNITTITLNLLDLVGTQWKYNQTEDLTGSQWYATNYDDSTWHSGGALLAFEVNANITPLVNTVLDDPRYGINGLPAPRVYYFRTTFNLTTNLQGFNVAASIRLDDGAIIYLNGVELPQRLRMNSGAVAYTDFATETPNPSTGDADTSEFLAIPTSMFVPGTNFLAVEVHQISANSSDIVWGMGLEATKTTTNVIGSSPVVINEVLANNSNVQEPDGSAPDWIELYNQSGSPVVLDGYSLTDDELNPRRWVFPAGTTIQPLGYLRILCDGNRDASTNNTGTLNTGFGLKAAGSGVYLYDPWPTNPPLSEVVFGLQATDFSIGRLPDATGAWALCVPTPDSANLGVGLAPVTTLRINEWMPRRSSGEDWFELYNPAAQPVALGGLYLSDDITVANRLKSLLPPLSFIGAGTNGYQQFVADGNATAGADHVSFKLDATREAIGLSTANATLIDGITYLNPLMDVSEGRFPDASTNVVRFPGTASPGEPNYRMLTNVVINEVLTRTDAPLEDAIELLNTTDAPINVGGWWLSDAKNALQKYRIPDNTIIQPHGFLVFYEAQFNQDTNDPACFGINSSGDEIYLSAADANGLTGYRASVRFGAALNGVAFGRYLTSDRRAEFVAMSANSFGVDDPATLAEFRTGAGQTNPYPRVGPVVISEIMYHPPDLGTLDNTRDEFIELRNITTSPVPLFEGTNGWRLRDGVDFDFPIGTVLPAGKTLLVVGFDPVNNPAALNAFRNVYGLETNMPILGPWAGKLANDNDDLELRRPDPRTTNGPSILVEHVHYYDLAPWSAQADGSGLSLQRQTDNEYGNDPINWLAATPSVGAAGSPSDSDADGMPDNWEIQNGFDPYNAADAAQDTDGDRLTNLQEFLLGTNPRDRASGLRLNIDPVPGSTNVVLSFSAVSNFAYTVEYCQRLETGWESLQTYPAGTSNFLARITVGPIGSVRLYRLRLGGEAPSESLKITGIQVIPGNQVGLQINLPANQSCTVLHAAEVNGPWNALTNYPAASTNQLLLLPRPASGTSGFYRLRSP